MPADGFSDNIIDIGDVFGAIIKPTHLGFKLESYLNVKSKE